MLTDPLTSHECRTSSVQVQASLSALTGTTAASHTNPHASGTKHGITSKGYGPVITSSDMIPMMLQPVDALSSALPPSGVTTFVNGSTTVCADLLTDICQTMHRRFTVKEGSLIVPTKRTNWVQSRIHGLLHDIFDGQRQNWHSLAVSASTPTQDERELATSLAPLDTTPSGTLARSTLLFFLKRTSLVEAASFEWLGRNAGADDSQNHDISLTLLTFQPPGLSTSSIAKSFTRCRLYVALTPTQDGQLKGVIIQFSEISGAQHQLWRTLTTFGVHPSNSSVFGHIRNRDVLALQRLLALALVAPNDRDEEGNSLLWVRTFLPRKIPAPLTHDYSS